MKTEACGATHKGNVRGHNEDNIYVDGSYRNDLEQDNVIIHSKRESGPYTYVVFDGLGGEACGEQASIMAAIGLRAMEDNGLVGDIGMYISAANRSIIQESIRKKAHNMGTTAAAAIVFEGHAVVFNVGDSRVYLFHEGELRQISKDHSITQTMIDSGLLKESDRNKSRFAGEITQYLGMVTEDDIEPEATVSDIEVRKGDILLLCSDGLTGELSDDEIRDIIANNIEDSASYLVARLLKRVVEGQARDNVSAIICKIVQ